MFQVLGGEHVANGSRIRQNSTEVQWSPYEIVKKKNPPSTGSGQALFSSGEL